MSLPTERSQALYELTPAVYRIADAELGEPLRALMSVLEEPYRLIEANVEALYDDWFIETCAAWLVPYIGELVGVRAAFDPAGVIPTVRARVGNAIAYSRRKGPAWVLARASRDATGWQARTVEFFHFLSQTQDLGDVRPKLGRTADLRFPQAVEAGTPFDRMAHTVEVRGPDSNGRWAADRIGLYLWRLSSYPLTGSQPRPVPGRDGCYTFDPFGVDTQLFLPPRAVQPYGLEPPPWDVPGPVSRELLQLAVEESDLGASPWADGDYPIVAIRAGDSAETAALLSVIPGDLSEWAIPWVSLTPAEQVVARPVAMVDPELGRLAFVGPRPAWVRADWSYGFSADVGGGPYARSRTDPGPGAGAFVAQVGQARQRMQGAQDAGTIAEALDLWTASTASEGVVVILDSATHAVPSAWVEIAPGRRLWIIAAAGQWPCLCGTLQLSGVERSGAILVGLAVDGGVRLRGQVDLTAQHCTLSPPTGRVPGDVPRGVAADDGFTGTVALSSAILGPLSVPATSGGLTIADSIVAGGVYAISAGSDADEGPAPPLSIARCTIFGLVRAQSITAQDAIFTDPVLVSDPDSGGFTCCFVQPGKHLPARDRCQPSEAASDVRPIFTSRRYGDAAFAQLAADCPASIRTGATDGAEMGAFHLLDTPRRESNLRASIDEFLPNGMEVVVEFVT